MGTTSANKDIATTQSNHGCVTPPVMSLAPPTPPAGPVPMPFVYTARSATASETETDLKVSGAPVLIKGSTMKLDLPGNAPTTPVQAVGGGDVVTHGITEDKVMCGIAVTQHGSSGTLANGKEVCKTGDSVRMAVINREQQVCQATVPLLRAGDADMAGSANASDAEKAEKVKAALLAQGAKEAAKSSRGHAPDLVSDPVDVASGQVIDSATDLSLPGVIPVAWRRSYSSGRNREKTALGRGGWTHGFEQWVVEEEEVITLRWVDGREVYFPKIGPGESAFHRRERLTLTRDRRGYVVHQHSARRIRTFEPLERDGSAMLRSIRDPYGHVIELAYESGRLRKITDTAGRELHVLTDERGRVVRLEVWAAKPIPRPPFPTPTAKPAAELVQWVDYAYHPEGELAAATNALRHTEAYAYDGYHRMVKKTLRNGIAFHYEYDDDLGGFCVRAYGDGGLHAVHLTPDPKKRTTLLAGSSEPRRYTWNAEGMVVREETPDGSFVRARVFDKDLFLTEESNAAGEKTTYAYDKRGNCIEKTDSAGNQTAWQYQGDLVIRQISPDGLSTSFTYDPHGALSSIAYPTGLTITFTRDAHGRLAGIHGPDGLIVGYAYDEHHNRAEVVSGRGGRTVTMFDALGRPIADIDPFGKTTRFEHDALGRVVAVHAPDGRTGRIAYDPRGRIRETLDAGGRATRYEHEGTGVRTSTTIPNGQRWTFEHDEDERLVRVKNPRFELYELEYDAAGRVERERTFDGRVLEYRYSTSGRVARIDYPDRTWRELAYDPLGNIVEDRSPHGTIRFKRDRAGRVLEAVVDEPTGEIVTVFERDRFGRVVVERQGEHEIRFSYDSRGRRATRVLPGGETTKFYHDAQDALAAVDHEGYKVAIERDTVGRVTRTHLYDGKVDIQQAYDALGRLAGQRILAGEAPAVILQRSYALDDHGRPIRVEDDRWGSTTYRYDDAGNLIEMTQPGFTECFDYDAAGALVGASDQRIAASADRWTTSPGDRVTNARDARYTYDARGRRVRKVVLGRDGRPEATTEYEWDCRDRLREVYLPDGRRVRLFYDAFGRRVRKMVFPAERADFARMVKLALEAGEAALPKPLVIDFLWDGSDVCVEFAGNGSRRAFVHHRPWHRPLLQSERGKVFAYVNDHLGTPKELVDSDGRIAWKARHASFGQVVATWRDPRTSQDVSSPFRLLGQYADEDIGLTHTQFRYFDPALGRWCSPDPLGFAGGPHLYGFNGAPTVTVDPLGLANLCAPSRSREDAKGDARERAGLPRDASPDDEFDKVPGYTRKDAQGNEIVDPLDPTVPVQFNADDSPGTIRSKLGSLGHYEIHTDVPDPNNPGQKTSVIIVEHPNDPNNPPHFHSGVPKGDPDPNYPYRTQRYSELNPNNLPDPHIYYDPPAPPES